MSQSLGVVAVVQPVQGVSRCWRCSVAELCAAPAFSGPVSFHEPASKGQLGGARQPCSSCVHAHTVDKDAEVRYSQTQANSQAHSQPFYCGDNQMIEKLSETLRSVKRFLHLRSGNVNCKIWLNTNSPLQMLRFTIYCCCLFRVAVRVSSFPFVY